MEKKLLDMKNISKTFGNVQALKGVSLDLYAGEVLALMGENGAGKSTLMNILSGSLQPTEGEIYLNGEKSSYLIRSQRRNWELPKFIRSFRSCRSSVWQKIFFWDDGKPLPDLQ